MVCRLNLGGDAFEGSSARILGTRIKHFSFNGSRFRGPMICHHQTNEGRCSPSDVDKFLPWSPIVSCEVHVIDCITTFVRREVGDEIFESRVWRTKGICDDQRPINPKYY